MKVRKQERGKQEVEEKSRKQSPMKKVIDQTQPYQ